MNDKRSGDQSNEPNIDAEEILAGVLEWVGIESPSDDAAAVGFELRDVVKTGGGSDGNFTAALGVPTLDGLGADGYGAHSDYEHIYYSSLEPRTKLMLLLFQTLR
jgi:acetylornithine deacetylase/succinyl-diaminopimelate desuccinylase-like protein